MPPMPSPATRPVTLTPRLSRMTIKATANKATLTNTRISAMALPSVELPSSSPTRLAMTPRMISRPQIAPCTAAAMTKKMSARRVGLGGASAKLSTMSIAAATMNKIVVRDSTRPMTPTASFDEAAGALPSSL